MNPWPLRVIELTFVDDEPGDQALAAGSPGGDGAATRQSRPHQTGLSARMDALEDRLGRLEAALGPVSTNPPGDADPLSISATLARIADALAPEKPDIVGTPYVAGRLGCTTVWVAEMVRKGEIPKNCLVPGTGNGKPWKFYRGYIDRWVETR